MGSVDEHRGLLLKDATTPPPAGEPEGGGGWIGAINVKRPAGYGISSSA